MRRAVRGVRVLPREELAGVAVDRLSKMHARDPVARHLLTRPGEVLLVRWADGQQQLKRIDEGKS